MKFLLNTHNLTSKKNKKIQKKGFRLGGKKQTKRKIPNKKKIKVKSKKNVKKKNKMVKTPRLMLKNLDTPTYHEKSIDMDLEKDINEKPKIILVYANWCGHCQAMKPNWDEMKQHLLEDQIYDTNDIIEIESNEQDLKLPKVNDLVTTGTKIDIQGYPTMGKIKNGTFNQYTGGRGTNELLNWAKYA